MTERGWLLAEDDALKKKLGGITVVDDREAVRPVTVFFRFPEGERKSMPYPFITIDLLDIVPARDRMMSLYPMEVPYIPSVAESYSAFVSTPPDLDAVAPLTWSYMPVDLTYQVTTWARDPKHDRAMMATLFSTGRLPFNWGHLFIEADNTVRNMFLVDWRQADSLDTPAVGNSRRIFRKVFTLTVSSEIPPFHIASVIARIETVNVTLVDTTDAP
jgi:hypothetical protein